MIVNGISSENALKSFLNSRDFKASVWRGLIINLSQSCSQDELKRIYSKAGIIVLNEVFKSEDGHIFIMHDGDLVIMIEGRIQEFLSKKINGDLQKAFGFNLSDHTEIYDMSKNSVLLYDYCDKKHAFKLEKNTVPEEKRQLKVNKALALELSSKRKKKPPQILIIEDDEMSRRMISNVLRKDAKVLEAECGYDGVNSYFLNAPDIVFLDIEMPEHNGLDVLKLIQKNDPDAFIVMLSGNAFKDNIQKAIEYGAKGFVAKPFTKDKLITYMNKCSSFRSKNV